jgi:hypothetical protein
VAGDDWYQRRRSDAEGRFWRRVADQGPRKGKGGSTRQGIYCFTADGQLLAYRNPNDPAVMRENLKKALRAWNKLPAERRRPGAVKIEEAGKLDMRYARVLPPGGLVVNVFTRILDRKDGGYCKGTCSRAGGDFAARDHLWLTAAECKALAPPAKKGATLEMPAAVRDRILRFHLVDNTRGEPPHWKAHEVRSRKMTLTVEEATPALVRLRLEGSALLATSADPKEAVRGYEVRLLGHIHFDRARKTITRFDVVALGEHWGEGHFTRGARPGRTPLGIAFELARGDDPADRVPPQAAREIHQYLGKGR